MAVPVIPAVDERLKTTSLSLSVGYGARHDPVEFGGIAHLLEHLLMSTPVAGLPSFSEHVERLGGYANAQTAPELMQFYAQVHADDADEIAELLHTAVLTPSFDAKLLDAERTVVLQELATGAADPADAVQDAILAELFAGHPLGRPVGGVPAELEAMTVDDVRREHTNTFLRSPMVLVVVGPRIPKPLLASPNCVSGKARNEAIIIRRIVTESSTTRIEYITYVLQDIWNDRQQTLTIGPMQLRAGTLCHPLLRQALL